MENGEREETIYHGTTYDLAQWVLGCQKFELKETFFASTKELAFLFAERSKRKHPERGIPVVLRVVLYESDLRQWKKNGLVVPRGFDEGDQPQLRGKTQLVFSAEAVRQLNLYMFKNELSIEARKSDAI